MKTLLIHLVVALLCLGCGGKLTDGQRQSIREEMKEGEIKRVSEAELFAATFAFGRSMREIFMKKDPRLLNSKLRDSVQTHYGLSIRKLNRNDSTLSEIELQIVSAYFSSGGVGDDNVQGLPGDSILYTWPIMADQTDSTMHLSSVAAIKIPVKQIILSIED